ncbi:MAG TPA: hypothetical protein VN326_05480 [Casimicrobiaceae bacterium]|nr:hypothetical protein [Casimicrobiaceae bacterium]
MLGTALGFRLKDANMDIEYRRRDRAGDHAPTWITLAEPVSKPHPMTISKGALGRATPRSGRDIVEKRI